MSFGSEHVVNFNLCAFSERPMNSVCTILRPELCEGNYLIKAIWMMTRIIMIKNLT